MNNLDEILSNKLEKEFKNFKDNLKGKTKEEIIDKAYDLVVKEEIKDELLNMDLYDKEKEMLIEQKDVLTEFYHDWLDTDVPLGEILRDTVEDSIVVLSRYYDKRVKEER